MKIRIRPMNGAPAGLIRRKVRGTLVIPLHFIYKGLVLLRIQSGVKEMSVRFQGRLGLGSQLLLVPGVLVCLVSANPGWAQSVLPAVDTIQSEPIAYAHLMTASSGWLWKIEHLFWTDTAGKTWTGITPPLATNQIIGGLYFLDAEHGWAVLKDSGIVTKDTWDRDLLPVSIATTINRGKSWSMVTLPEDKPIDYTGGQPSFPNETRGWLLMGIPGSSASSRSALFTAVDGGTTWSSLPFPPIAGRIRFFSDGTGWLVGGVHGNELYHTGDGGQTWMEKDISLPKQVQPYTTLGGDGKTYPVPVRYSGPYFSKEQKGILVVSVPVSEQNEPSLTYTTEDGGDTWQLQKLDTGENSVGTIIGPGSFFDSTFMKLGSPGGTSAGILAFYPDSPATAKPILTRLPNKRSVVTEADFLDALHGWLIMSDNSLLGTSDGGKTLTVLVRSDRPKPPNFPVNGTQEKVQ